MKRLYGIEGVYKLKEKPALFSNIKLVPGIQKSSELYVYSTARKGSRS